jgi:hypothetical protein
MRDAIYLSLLAFGFRCSHVSRHFRSCPSPSWPFSMVETVEEATLLRKAAQFHRERNTFRVSFLLKNILPKETGSSDDGVQRREERKETRLFGRRSLDPTSIQGSSPSPPFSPWQRKAPPKPVSRVSQSRVKQSSAFAPSPEKRGKWAAVE